MLAKEILFITTNFYPRTTTIVIQNGSNGYTNVFRSRDLLTEDGVIFVSIDDIEFARIKLLLDEVFDESSFMASLIWETDGNTDNQAKFKISHEDILVYSSPPTPSDGPWCRPGFKTSQRRNPQYAAKGTDADRLRFVTSHFETRRHARGGMEAG
jgi:DNA methylase